MSFVNRSRFTMASVSNGDDTTKNKVALITGITGQDGSYLAEFLIGK